MPLQARQPKTDNEVMTLLQAGRPEGFALLYERHHGAAFALACRLLGDPTLAEEVVQDSFLAVWHESSRYEPGRGAVRSWIYGIVHHRAVDALRRKARLESRQAYADGLLDRQSTRASPEPEPEQIDLAELGLLPAAQRQVIMLAFQHGLTCDEIAQFQGVPLGTVKGRMRLGLEKLRRSVRRPGRAEPLAA